MSPRFAVQETRGSDLCLLLDLLMIRWSHAVRSFIRNGRDGH